MDFHKNESWLYTAILYSKEGANCALKLMPISHLYTTLLLHREQLRKNYCYLYSRYELFAPFAKIIPSKNVLMHSARN